MWQMPQLTTHLCDPTVIADCRFDPTFVEGTDFQVLQSERHILLSTTGLQGYTNAVSSTLDAVPTSNGAFLPRSVPQLYLEQYQTYMNLICNGPQAHMMQGQPQ